MPLPGLVKVNELVSIYQPSVEKQQLHPDTPQSTTAPENVLLLTWGDAQDRYIEKYIVLSTETWPEARIIIVKNGVAGFFFRSNATAQKLVEPVIKILSESQDDRLYVHVMSNAGSKSWCTINQSYFEHYRRVLHNAPTVFDSAPGRMRFNQTWAAVAGTLPQAKLPRLALSIILGLCLGVVHLRKHLVPGGDLYEVVRVGLNNQLSSLQTGVRRCYIYSEEDDIIGWQDVEDHAKDAEKKGWDVALIKYVGSTHVGHFKKDPAKYRQAVKDTWLSAKL